MIFKTYKFFYLKFKRLSKAVNSYATLSKKFFDVRTVWRVKTLLLLVLGYEGSLAVTKLAESPPSILIARLRNTRNKHEKNMEFTIR